MKAARWIPSPLNLMAVRMDGGGGPAPFLIKTYHMVEDVRTEEVVSWGEEGRSFVVWKPVEFARDLLPANFKHNNFSSFVRQLNTYGFRKVVPDRWEFSHDNFRRGEQRLLREIRRRKAAPPPPPISTARKSSGGELSNSCGDILSSSSTSSPPPLLSPADQQLLDLSNEKKKLKKNNEVLAAELASAKRRYEDILEQLRKDNEALAAELADAKQLLDDLKTVQEGQKEIEEEGGEDSKGLKLFGVILKGLEGEEMTRRKKRDRCEEGGISDCGGGRPVKMGFAAPWMGVSSTTQGGGKVCN